MSMPVGLANEDREFMAENVAKRKRLSRMFYGVCVAIAMVSVIILVILLVSITWQGRNRLTSDLLNNPHSELEIEKAGMRPAIIGSLCICGVCAFAALPLGVGTAIFLEEFKPTSKLLTALHGFVQLNISNLAGVPSIVYGLLGLSVFVFMFNVFGRIQVNESAGTELMGVQHYYQLLSLDPTQTVLVPRPDMEQKTVKVEVPTAGFTALGEPIEIGVWTPGTPKPTDPEVRRKTVRKGAVGGAYAKHEWYYFRLPFGQSFLSAGLTLALVILPIIIIASQEALRSVSPSLREASLGLGATTWQTVWNVTLPAALPGIMTGSILAMGRAIGEAAPVLVVLGAAIAKNTGPQHLMDSVVTMPVLIYNWAGRQQDEFKELAAAAIVILLIVLLSLNLTAIIIRQKMQQPQ